VSQKRSTIFFVRNFLPNVGGFSKFFNLGFIKEFDQNMLFSSNLLTTTASSHIIAWPGPKMGPTHIFACILQTR